MCDIKHILFSCMFFVGLFQGCGSSTSSSNGSINVASVESGSDTGLQTLSEENRNLQDALQKSEWKEIVCNVSKLYNDAAGYPEVMQNYSIQMQFSQKEVLAYADCQKITARYKVREDEISFSEIAIAPAIELASCQEFEYADDAVLGFFENSYTLQTIRKNEIVLEADTVDTSVILKQ